MTSLPDLHGVCPPRFNAVKDAFAANFTDAPEGLNELAARFSVTIDGEVVADTPAAETLIPGITAEVVEGEVVEGTVIDPDEK